MSCNNEYKSGTNCDALRGIDLHLCQFYCTNNINLPDNCSNDPSDTPMDCMGVTYMWDPTTDISESICHFSYDCDTVTPDSSFHNTYAKGGNYQ